MKMIDRLEETIHDNEAEILLCKRAGLDNPKNYVVTHNRSITYLVLIFSELNKAQICKMPYGDSLNHEIEILMGSIFLFCLNQMNTQKIMILEN